MCRVLGQEQSEFIYVTNPDCLVRRFEILKVSVPVGGGGAAGKAKDKAKDLYDKAAPKAKEAFEGVKAKGAALADKAKDKIQDLKAKKEEKKEA